jgi:phosphoribosyl 1,2-cyclic phosphodiesterase
MQLFITSLNSGSNGNCYYIGNDNEAVLIDAGISCREVEKRMRNLQLSMKLIKAIFISHEHTDHIRGVRILATKYQIPVYITPPTLSNSQLNLEKDLINSFKAKEEVSIGNLSVTPFTKHHDAADPYSFIVTFNGIKVGIITDIGISCSEVIHHFKQCHAVFLESNYDEQMLETGNYPLHLKNRIRNGKGHLSNRQALQLFVDHKPEFMSHLLLSHLSENNNCPKIVHDLFKPHSKSTKIIVAPRTRETPVYTITHHNNINITPRFMPVQMNIFENTETI